MVVPFPIGGVFTKAARFNVIQDVYLTDCRTAPNAMLTITTGTDPDQPWVTGYGIYLYDHITHPRFPHGADVEDDV